MAQVLIKRNMRLFGLPYQFLPEVDPRFDPVSKTVGRKFAENIILDAPVVSIIPGKPKYLAADKDKRTTTQALLSAASDDFSVLKAVINGKNTSGDVFKYYDFERAYTEYMTYVNILCRTCATFLEIDEKIDGVSCQQYDYRNYKWNTESMLGSTSTERIINSIRPNNNTWKNYIAQNYDGGDSSINVGLANTTIAPLNSNKMKYETTSSDSETASLEELMTNYNYVQFFVDTDVTANDNMSNNTTESKIKGMLDTGSDLIKEIAFVANSGGIETADFEKFAEESMQGIADSIGSSNAITGILSRVLNLAGNVAKGENIIMPDIYQNSSYEKSYSFTVHLKTPYGTKFGYFMDICVPLMHLLCLSIPKQTSANTYGSPFLIKAYCEGLFTCNMGMVQSISISKGVNSSFSVDGLPTEVDVSLTIADLYSDLSMSPQSSPLLFVNNNSLIEYLATTCGLSLISPNLSARLDMIVNAISNALGDIDTTVISSITEEIDKLAMDFLKLTR